MHVEPLGVAAVPHARLLRLAGARPALAVYVLRQADVGYAGGVLADQVDVRVEDGGVHRLAVFTQHCGGRGEGRASWTLRHFKGDQFAALISCNK